MSEENIQVVKAPAGAGRSIRLSGTKWSHVKKYLDTAAEFAATPGDPELRGVLYKLTSGKETGFRQAVRRYGSLFPNLRFAVTVQDAEAGEFVITAHPKPAKTGEATGTDNTGAQGGVDGEQMAA